jgi:carboxyl-terminal processing protease
MVIEKFKKMKMKKLVFLPLIFMALFVSCKKNDIPPTFSPAMARDSLYKIMKGQEWYLWYNLMPAVTKEDYPDPYTLLDAMRYKTLDRWSYILTAEEYYAQMTGTFVGHGFRIGFDGTNARIAMIYSNSPLYAQGVRRGWIVKSINNTLLAPVLQLNDGGEAYSTLIQPSVAGVINSFVFTKPDGTELSISSTKASFTMNTVLLADTLRLSSGVTGHLVFDSFFNPAPSELATAFTYFQSMGIKDLILDLRYNSGGDLYIAQTLASYIAGNARQGITFAKLSYNDKHQDENMTIPFKTISNSLSLTTSRIVVITTRSTASASEDVMNSLKPFFNVVTIGETTNGKPTGMNGWNIENTYFMFPVTFKVVNSQGQGDFFAGFAPDKPTADDITRDFKDRQELCLKEAIYYLETGSLSSTKSLGSPVRYNQFSEKPEWMNNAIIMSK